MKFLFLFSFILLLSCNNDNLTFVSQEVINGKVSETKKGVHGSEYEVMPKIWVQSPTQTKEVEIPFEYEDKWKIGDSCLLIVQKYKEIKKQSWF